MTEDLPRAGIYVRISLDREGRALGIDRQEKACRELCERDGFEVAGVYADNDKSASRYATKARPQYEQLLADARAGTIGVIVAYSSSRLTRRLRTALDLIELAESGTVRIRTVVSGQYDLSTASGRTMAKIVAVMDEQESEVNSERSRAEREQRRERGMPHGGQRPFGWRSDGRTPHEVEWPLIRAGADALLAGVPLSQVARDWSAATGRAIRATTARRVLRSQRIAGRLVDGRPAVWAPVVTPEESAALRGVLNGTHVRYAEQLLTGWALCGVCRAAGVVSVMRSVPTRAGNPGYRCGLRAHLIVTRPPRDEHVREVVAAYIDTRGVQPAAVTAGAGAAVRHAAAQGRLDEIADMLGAGELTREQAARATALARRQLAAAETDLATTRTANLPESGTAFLALDTARQRATLFTLPWRAVIHSPGRGVRRFDPATVVMEPVA